MTFKTDKEIAELKRLGKHDEAKLEEARIYWAKRFKLPKSEEKRITRQFMRDLHGV